VEGISIMRDMKIYRKIVFDILRMEGTYKIHIPLDVMEIGASAKILEMR
jgi:hypothetical protein